MSLKSLSKDELQRLLEVADTHDRLMFLLAFNHGLRVTELVGGWLTDKHGNKEWYPGLTAENFVDGYLIVQRLKGSNRTIQKVLANEAALLNEYLQGRTLAPGEKLFKMDRTTAWRHMKALGVAAGIPAFRCFPHALKHSTATVGLAGGMTLPEVQARLGHKSGSSTMVYLGVTEDAASEAFEKAVSL